MRNEDALSMDISMSRCVIVDHMLPVSHCPHPTPSDMCLYRHGRMGSTRGTEILNIKQHLRNSHVITRHELTVVLPIISSNTVVLGIPIRYQFYVFTLLIS